MTDHQTELLRWHVEDMFSGHAWGSAAGEATGRAVLDDPFCENGSKFTARFAAQAISGDYGTAAQALLESEEFRSLWQHCLAAAQVAEGTRP